MDNTRRQSAGKNLAWFAGFLNGDGHISLLKQNMGKNRIIYSPKVGATNTDHSLIEECADILDNEEVGYYINDKKSKNGIAKNINVKGFKRVTKLLPLMIPELRGKKKRQAELLLEWIISRKETGQNNTYTERELEIYNQIRELKKPD
jgi:hypothetical protein